MLTFIRESTYRLANLQNAILLWIVYTSFSILIFNFGFLSALSKKAQGNIILDNTFFYYSVNYVNQLFTTYGEEGRRLYLLHLLAFDFIYPILFFVANAILLISLLNYLMPAAKFINQVYLLPLVPMVLDYLENFGILLLLASYPHLHNVVVSITSITTIIKLVLVNISFLLTNMLVISATLKFTYRKIT